MFRRKNGNHKYGRSAGAAMIVAVLLLAVVLGGAALGEAAVASETGALKQVFDAEYALLFETENVTIDATADFTLDGQQIKQLIVHHEQNGDESLRELTAKTGDRQTGYTVTASDTMICARESFHEWAAQYWAVEERDRKTQVLTHRVGLDALVKLAGALAADTDRTAGAAVQQEKTADGGLSMSVDLAGADLPPAVVSAFELGAQYVAGLYKKTDMADKTVNGNASIEYFLTPAEGMIWSVGKIEPTRIAMHAEIGADGLPATLRAEARLLVTENIGTVHDMTVVYTQQVTNAGTTAPDVSEAGGSGDDDLILTSYGVVKVPLTSYAAPAVEKEIRTEVEADAYAREMVAKLDPDFGDILAVTTTRGMHDGYGSLWLSEMSGSAGHMVCLSYMDNGLIAAWEMTNGDNSWLDWTEDKDDKYLFPTAEEEEEIGQWMRDMAESIDPGVTSLMYPPQLQWAIREQSGDYYSYWMVPEDDRMDAITMTMWVKPDGSRQLMYFSATSNG